MAYVKHRDAAWNWRWRYVAANGRIIAVSSEGYINEGDCDRSIEIMKSSHSAPVRKE